MGATDAKVPDRSGLKLYLRQKEMNLDPWIEVLSDSEDTREDEPDILNNAYINVGSAILFNRRIGNLRVYSHLKKSAWHSTLGGDTVHGKFIYAYAKPVSNFIFNLDKLVIPDEEVSKKKEEDASPEQMPNLDIKSASFFWGKRDFGRLDFSARHFERGWQINKITLQRPETKLTGRATWLTLNGRQRMTSNMELESENIGQTVSAMGYPNQVVGGKTKLTSELRWAERDGRVNEWQNIDGRVELKIVDGRFVEVDQGAAGFFGLFDITSIGKLITLDFSSAFSKGLPFNDLSGKINIRNGSAYAEDFNLHSPSLRIGVNGKVGLVTKDYDLQLHVEPRLTSATTFTAWQLLGLEIAASIYALQKIFKKEIAKKTKVIYEITGPWKRPIVTKIGEEENNKANINEEKDKNTDEDEKKEN